MGNVFYFPRLLPPPRKRRGIWLLFQPHPCGGVAERELARCGGGYSALTTPDVQVFHNYPTVYDGPPPSFIKKGNVFYIPRLLPPRGKEGVDCEQSEQDGAVQYNHTHTRYSNISQLPHRLRRSPPSFIKKGNIPHHRYSPSFTAPRKRRGGL